MTWGVPDWRGAAAYPAKLGVWEWWWQFTRRRPDYRELWQTLWPAQQAWSDANLDWFRETAERDGCTFDEAVEWRRSRHVPGGLKKREEIRARYKLDGVPDPRTSYDDHFLRHVFWNDSAGAVEYGCFDPVERDQDKGYILFRFNLDRPIEAQLQFAKEYLSDMQKHGKGKAVTWRPRRDNWPLFLRALDARDADATYSDMAETFWPGQSKTAQSARDTYDAACQLRDNFPI